MARLVFTTDGLICEQDAHAAPAMLARVVERSDGTASLLATDVEHVTTPLAPAGWAFELRDRAGLRSGGFEPFRLRRGGRISVGEVELSLCSRPWSHDGWTFSTPREMTVEATVAVAEPAADAKPSAIHGRAGGALQVTLESSCPLAQPQALALALALGCWLIVRWHSDPALDHVLASPPGARELARSSGDGAVAGIAARAAN